MINVGLFSLFQRAHAFELRRAFVSRAAPDRFPLVRSVRPPPPASRYRLWILASLTLS